MPEFGKALVVLGAASAVVGIVLVMLSRYGVGRLPGDISRR